MFGNSITKFFKLDSLINNLTGYFESKVELVKVEVKQEVNAGVSQAIVYLLIAFVFGMVILFISTGVAVLLVDIIGPFAAYGIVALFYLIIGIVLVFNREQLIRKVNSNLSKTTKSRK